MSRKKYLLIKKNFGLAIYEIGVTEWRTYELGKETLLVSSIGKKNIRVNF